MGHRSYMYCDHCQREAALGIKIAEAVIQIRRDGGMRQLEGEICNDCYNNLIDNIRQATTKQEGKP